MPKPFLARIDYPLLLGLLLLMLGSLFILYSSSGGSEIPLRQALRFGSGFLLFFLMLLIPTQQLRRLTPAFYLLTVVLLLLVVLAGSKVNGAQRWLNIGIVKIQPSELAKIIVPMAVAWYSTIRHAQLSLADVAVNLLIIGLSAGLIFVEPDLGTTLLVGASGFIALFLAGLQWWLIVLAALALAIAAPLFWLYGIKEYQRDRIITFLNPEADPWGNGYHIIQSKIAIGSGGFYGKGYQLGTQSQLEFLPESNTDFVFSVLGEEFGLLGVMLLLLCYGFIIYRGLYLSTRLTHPFGRIIVATTFLSFFINIFVNIGMVSGILPVVGLPLALISYGGSSIISLFVGFGIACNLASAYREVPESERMYL